MKSLPKPELSNPVHFLAFGFGSGLAPKAPGTIGTLASLPVLYLMSYLIVLSVIIIVGIWICQKASEDLKIHDHPGIVWDEFAGMFVTMIAVPVTWLTVAVGFALFRLSDIWKPWPIGLLDKKVSGGLGIMLDDIVAGAFAAGVLQLAIHFEWLKLN